MVLAFVGDSTITRYFLSAIFFLNLGIVLNRDKGHPEKSQGLKSPTLRVNLDLRYVFSPFNKLTRLSQVVFMSFESCKTSAAFVETLCDAVEL